jgi:hypothetical protein
MKGKDLLLHSLSTIEIELWYKNVANRDIDYILNSEYDSLEQLLLRSFVWSDTEEGFWYWNKISFSDRKYSLVQKKKIPTVKL